MMAKRANTSDLDRSARLLTLLARNPRDKLLREGVDANLRVWEKTPTGHNPAAVELGRLGGSTKTDKPKGLAKLSPDQREAIRAKALVTRRAKKDQQA